MRLSLRQILFSMGCLAVALVTVIFMNNQVAVLGTQPTWVRAVVLSLAVLAALLAILPFNPVFSQRKGLYVAVICLPALLPGLVYFLVVLPAQATGGLNAEQQQLQLISDRSSNGLVEIGFSYPIFTPTIRVSSSELFTRRMDVYFRLVDETGQSTLYRGVRKRVPGSALSVESTVRGMLEQNDEYSFLPLDIPPMATVSTRPVFVITNNEDGRSFTRSLQLAQAAVFELRDAESGSLIQQFPALRE